MKFLRIYEDLGFHTKDEVFEYFMKSLKHTNRIYDFFIDWSKIFQHVENIEIELNILNYLIGKTNIKDEFIKLIDRHPEIVPIIPILIAVRDENLEILTNYKTPEWEYKNFSFEIKEKYSLQEINDIVEFCEKIGLLNLFQDRKIKNLVDYCIGLEVGIDTNSRKNRSGDIMESIIEWHLSNLCNKLKLEYISQATKSKIYKKWKLELPVDKNSRKYDFAILSNSGRLILIETNFFSDGGSKLKSVAGEFQALDKFLKNHHIVEKFIWITDGIGWNSAKSSLYETYTNNDFVINTKMITDGVLEEIIKLQEDN